VSLDSLLTQITKQQNVKKVVELQELNNRLTDLTINYSGGGYNFAMKLKGYSTTFISDADDENTVFYDGKHRFAFRDYKVTCYDDTNYECEDFAFNSYHTLGCPEIIEVCGKRFLYAFLFFACNGKGCAQELTMIYDIQEKKLTFLGNYRLEFKGYRISDFNDDGVPDIFVIAKTPGINVGSSSALLPLFDMKILVYTYNKGVFELNENNYYDLDGIGYGLADSFFEQVLSIKKDSWFLNSAIDNH